MSAPDQAGLERVAAAAAFVAMIARMTRDGEDGFEPDPDDAMLALDGLIVKARALAQAAPLPPADGRETEHG